MFVKLIKWCDQCKPFLLGAQAFLVRSAGFSCLERRLLLVTKSVMRWSPRSYSLGWRNSQRCHLLFRISKSLLFSPNWGSVRSGGGSPIRPSVLIKLSPCKGDERSGGGILIPLKQKFLPSVSCFSLKIPTYAPYTQPKGNQ